MSNGPDDFTRVTKSNVLILTLAIDSYDQPPLPAPLELSIPRRQKGINKAKKLVHKQRHGLETNADLGVRNNVLADLTLRKFDWFACSRIAYDVGQAGIDVIQKDTAVSYVSFAF